MNKRAMVTFLSDYGLEDEFVGVCHGVMLKIAPQLRIVDVHHNILRQNIRHGAIVLEQSARFLPECVCLAVVDPSVGSHRRAVVVTTTAGSVFVGPDNGLLVPAINSVGGVKSVFEITNEEYMLVPTSKTFQGRDVFAPAAAHVANGVDPSELGPEVKSDDLVEFEISKAWIHEDHLHAEVLQVDRFGNLQLNVGREQLKKLGIVSGSNLEIRMEGHRLTVPFCDTFSDVKSGEFVVIEDSYQQLSVAINNGDAAARLRSRAGSTTIVGPSGG